jgi:hypothetical protein
LKTGTRRRHISNFAETTEQSRTVSKFSLGGPNRLTTRAIRFGNGKSIRKAWMEECPPWTRFEPGDGRPDSWTVVPIALGIRCATSPVTPADEIDSSRDSSGSAIHWLPDGTRTRMALSYRVLCPVKCLILGLAVTQTVTWSTESRPHCPSQRFTRHVAIPRQNCRSLAFH